MGAAAPSMPGSMLWCHEVKGSAMKTSALGIPLSSFRLVVAVLAAMSFLSWWMQGSEPTMPAASAKASMSIATFAGGCLWCMQPPFDELAGVLRTTPGYTGGTKTNPTDEEVLSGMTGHAEAIEVVYDPGKVSYEKLLDVFWHNIDPLTRNAQFCDHGTQYRTAIFYHDDAQRKLAEAAKSRIETSAGLQSPIVTQIVKADIFYPAEDYHRELYGKSSEQYVFYRNDCGRDARLRQVWGAAAPID
jgi:peptide-methionine (S)-S-oxide reductase